MNTTLLICCLIFAALFVFFFVCCKVLSSELDEYKADEKSLDDLRLEILHDQDLTLRTTKHFPQLYADLLTWGCDKKSKNVSTNLQK